MRVEKLYDQCVIRSDKTKRLLHFFIFQVYKVVCYTKYMYTKLKLHTNWGKLTSKDLFRFEFIPFNAFLSTNYIHVIQMSVYKINFRQYIWF